MRAEVTTARELGISWKRFRGWEPRTIYEYDDDGRMIASRPEPEWDDVEQAWMLALSTWERDEVCPLCGLTRDICRDPLAEWTLNVPPPERCHVTTAIRRAQEARGDGKHDAALLWKVERAGATSSP